MCYYWDMHPLVSKYRSKAIRRHSRRIAELTESIDGTDEYMYPHHVRELEEKRKHHAFKRSTLIKKVGIVL
jgi:hypothetical protein